MFITSFYRLKNNITYKAVNEVSCLMLVITGHDNLSVAKWWFSCRSAYSMIWNLLIYCTLGVIDFLIIFYPPPATLIRCCWFRLCLLTWPIQARSAENCQYSASTYVGDFFFWCIWLSGSQSRWEIINQAKLKGHTSPHMQAHVLVLFSALVPAGDFTLPNHWFAALPHNPFRLGQFFMGCAVNREILWL